LFVAFDIGFVFDALAAKFAIFIAGTAVDITNGAEKYFFGHFFHLIINAKGTDPFGYASRYGTKACLF
jgi:hypothetical protein